MQKPPKGTRDFLPEKAKKLQYVIDTIRNVFEKYGFSPIYTPAFENFSLLAAKGGLGEGVKDEIYYFKDRAQRELGLRFDLTMPLARIVAANPQLQKPFKRYAIDRVWRYDNPQALRYREFWQADIDIVGSASLEADAECLAAICECLDRLGFKDFYIRVNNRKLLQNIFEKIIEKEKILETFRTIDKLDKIGEQEVRKELEQKGVDQKKIMQIIKIIGSAETLKKIKTKYGDSEGVSELLALFNYAKVFGIEKRLKIDLSLVRGLDYYTSMVYEIGSGISMGGGGRYDNLIGLFGKQTPATGISLGIDRIIEIMEEKNLFKDKAKKKIFIAAASDTVRYKAIKICQQLRKAGLQNEFDLMNRSLARQMEYAQNFDFVLIVGPKELKKKSVKLRNMKTGKEKTVKIKNLAEMLKNISIA